MPDIADRYARHTTALGLAAGHEEAFRSLERILEAQGRFKLALVQFNDPAVRDAVIAKVAETHPQARVLHVSAAEFPDFSVFEQRLAETAQAHNIVHVTGLESWLFPMEGPSRAAGFNYHREAIAERCPACLLLWLTEPDIGQFAIEAPDMWAWRAGVLDFSVEKDKQDIFPIGTDELSKMPLPNRVRRINELHDYFETISETELVTKCPGLLDELGWLYHSIGKEQKAIKSFEINQKLAHVSGNRQHEGTALIGLGEAYRGLGKYDEALESFLLSLDIQRQEKSLDGEGAVLNNLAGVYVAQGRYAEAEECLKKALAISRELGNRRREALRLNNLAALYSASNRLDLALELFQQGVAIQREFGDLKGEMGTLNNMAYLYRKMGELGTALELLTKALAIARDIGSRSTEGLILRNVGSILQQQGKLADASNYLFKSLDISRQVGDLPTESMAMWDIGRLLLSTDVVKARTYLEESLSLQHELKDPQYEGLLTWFQKHFPSPNPETPT